MGRAMLSDQRILLVVGGGIAAFKALDLIRRLREAGASVTPVLTRAAEEFVTPLSVSALAASKAHRDLFDLTSEAEMGHIELSRAADLVVVAPATANLMGKMAAGIADDLATTVLMATDKRVLIAPAMNVRMWEHPATRRNLARLREDGVLVCGPSEGPMACGEFGPGRLAEVPDILAAIEAALGEAAGDTVAPGPAPSDDAAPGATTPGGAADAATRSGTAAGGAPERAAAGRLAGSLSGRRVVVTSGPTHEPIDPVRYIANRSSGAQGAAIGRALAERGAEVVFVTGPAGVPPPEGVEVRRVETAAQMLDAVLAALPAHAFVAAAAVADWRVDAPGGPSASKLKKGSGGPPALRLIENPDVLATVAAHPARPALVVGFAAETDEVARHAAEKRARKGCDWIVANDVSPATGVMGGSDNAVTLITADGAEEWPRMPKAEVAARLADRIAEALAGPADERRAGTDGAPADAPPQRGLPAGLSDGFRDALAWHLERHRTAVSELARATGVSPDAIDAMRARGAEGASAEDAASIAAFYGRSLDAFIRQGHSGAPDG